MKPVHVGCVTNKSLYSKLVLLAVVIATISIFSFLPKDAFADHFCSQDNFVCVSGHVENANMQAVVGKPFSVTYIVDSTSGNGFVSFNFHALKSEDGQYYLINQKGSSSSYHVDSTGNYISPVSASFMATKEGQFTIELDISAGKNPANDIGSKQYFTVKTPQAVPEFPVALIVLLIAIASLVAFYRITPIKI